jgi:hypothetical protein
MSRSRTGRRPSSRPPLASLHRPRGGVGGADAGWPSDPVAPVTTRSATAPAPLRRRQVAALAAPPVLIATTYAAFQGLVGWLGERWGYLAGFLFFWLVWCAGFSLWAIGPRGLAAVLRDARPRLPRPQLLWLTLLAVPVAGGFATVLLPDLPRATLAVVAVAWLIAGVNATLEEVFWRGVYIRLFPGRPVAGWRYPMVTRSGEAWHVARGHPRTRLIRPDANERTVSATTKDATTEDATT